MLRSVWVLALFGCNGGDVAVAPDLVWGDELLDFGIVPEDTTSTLPFTLSNDGGGTVRLLSATISLGDRDVWSVDHPRGLELGAGEQVDLLVSFRPDQADGRFAGELHVRTDDTPGVFVMLTGEAAASIADEDGDGYTIADGDCDDGDRSVHPGAEERCNGRDDDCSGAPDVEEVDEDGDGWRVCAEDCDDTDPVRYPGAIEVCDGLDDDCDGTVEDDLDEDGDGLTICGGDCIDYDPQIHPDFPERCDDNRDNDCDGTVDQIDADLDGHDACGPAPDCDDADPAVFPRAVAPGGDDTSVGSWAEPLGSLQAALDSVQPACPAVYLADGTYAPASGSTAAEIVGRGSAPADVVLGDGTGRSLELSSGTWRLRNLSVRDGVVEGPGGGIRILGGRLVLRDVLVEANSGTDGGGVAASATEIVLETGVRFADNVASGSGGALWLDGGSLVDIAGSTFVGNEAVGSGGAIDATGLVQLFGPQFTDDTAGVDGGAVALHGGEGHVVQSARFTGNVATGAGGALFLDVGYVEVRNGVFVQNVAENGGAVRLVEGGTFTNNTLVDNTATTGAAVHLTGGAEVRANLAHFNAGDGGFWTDVPAPLASHNTVFGTAGADWVGAWGPGAGANRTENPGFVAFSDDGDPSNDDLTLSGGSPSIDSGPPASRWNDPDGTRNDRGHTGGPGAN